MSVVYTKSPKCNNLGDFLMKSRYTNANYLLIILKIKSIMVSFYVYIYIMSSNNSFDKLKTHRNEMKAQFMKYYELYVHFEREYKIAQENLCVNCTHEWVRDTSCFDFHTCYTCVKCDDTR